MTEDGYFDATAALTRYDEPDELVLQALGHLAAQEGVRLRILLLDQADASAEFEMECARLSSPDIQIQRVEIPARSLSFARNAAIERTLSDLLLFIDVDAFAAPDWAFFLIDSLSRPDVAVAGSRILPVWLKKPFWLTRSAIVLDQYSVLDLGDETKSVDRVVGAGFGVDLARLGRTMRFDENLGRRDGLLFGGEETDFCRRNRARGETVIYDGRSVVYHQISPERMTFRWLTRRMYYAGIGRCRAGGRPNPSRRLNVWDFLALPVILPSYALGYWHARRGARNGASRRR